MFMSIIETLGKLMPYIFYFTPKSFKLIINDNLVKYCKMQNKNNSNHVVNESKS